MRALVVGAGASIEEAKRAGVAEEFWPPTVMNFAEKMWDSPHNQFFNYWLSDYLTENGINPGGDPTSVFIELAHDPKASINVERLFEYCWENKGKKFEGDWENLIYHGVLNPLTFLLLMAFYKNGEGIRQLEAGKIVSRKLEDGDLVMNLNYDTLFQIAAVQSGRQGQTVSSKSSHEPVVMVLPLSGRQISILQAWPRAHEFASRKSLIHMKARPDCE